MSEKNQRVHVTFKENINKVLTQLAKKENRSVTSIVQELTLEALELCEDLLLSNLAEN